jgi:hypothetical protein
MSTQNRWTLPTRSAGHNNASSRRNCGDMLNVCRKGVGRVEQIVVVRLRTVVHSLHELFWLNKRGQRTKTTKTGETLAAERDSGARRCFRLSHLVSVLLLSAS